MASTSKRQKLSNGNISTEERYFVIHMRDGFACLLCNRLFPCQSVNDEIKKHYYNYHWRTEEEYKTNSSLRTKTIQALKKKFFTVNKNSKEIKSDMESLNMMALKIIYRLAKNLKPLQDGDTLKKLFIDVISDLMYLCNTRVNFISVVDSLSMSPKTIQRRIELISGNLQSQLRRDLRSCVWYSLLIGMYDGPFGTSVDSKPLLAISIRMVFEDMSVKEELLNMITLPKIPKAMHLYTAFKGVLWRTEIPRKKMASLMIDTASPYMEEYLNEIVNACKNDTTMPKLVFYKCPLHLAETCLDGIKMGQVIIEVQRMIKHLEEHDQNDELLKQLTMKKKFEMVMNFYANLPTIRAKLDQMNIDCYALNTADWVIDLSIYADLANRLTVLTNSIKGDQRQIWKVVNSIVHFRDEINEWTYSLLENKCPPVLPRTQAALCELEVKLSAKKDAILAHLESMLQRTNDVLKHFTTVVHFAKSFVQPAYAHEDDIENYVLNMKKAGVDISRDVFREFEKFEKHDESTGPENKLNDELGRTWNSIWNVRYPHVTSIYQRNLASFGTGFMSRKILGLVKQVLIVNKFELRDFTLKEVMRIVVNSYTPEYATLRSSKLGTVI